MARVSAVRNDASMDAGIQRTFASILRIAEQHLRARHVEHRVGHVGWAISWAISCAAHAWVRNRGGVYSPYPLDIPRFMTMTCLLFHACSTGMPAMGEPGSSAIGFTVSFAPMTSVTSVSPKSSLISSISRTTARRNGSRSVITPRHGELGDSLSYGTEASANRTLHCPGMLRLDVVSADGQTSALGRDTPAGHWVDRETHVDTFRAQRGHNVRDGILGFGDRHAIAYDLKHDDVQQYPHQRAGELPTRMTFSALDKASTVSSTDVFVMVPSIL